MTASTVQFSVNKYAEILLLLLLEFVSRQHYLFSSKLQGGAE